MEETRLIGYPYRGKKEPIECANMFPRNVQVLSDSEWPLKGEQK